MELNAWQGSAADTANCGKEIPLPCRIFRTYKMCAASNETSAISRVGNAEPASPSGNDGINADRYEPITYQVDCSEGAIRDAVGHAMMLGESHLTKASYWNVDIAGARILELGPGPNYGSTLIPACLGATVAVADAWLPPWHNDYHPRVYKGLIETIRVKWPEADVSPIQALIDANCHAPEIIREIPVGAEKLPVRDLPHFDYVVSNAVFEHVPDILQASRNLIHVTAPGGINIHQVDMRDHRCFDRPLDYLLMSAEEEDRHLEATEYHVGSLRRKDAYDSAFADAGFEILSDYITQVAEPDYLSGLLPRIRASQQSRYANTSRDVIEVLGVTYVIRRPSASA